MAEHDYARQARPMTTVEQAVCTDERNLRAVTTLRNVHRVRAESCVQALDGQVRDLNGIFKFSC